MGDQHGAWTTQTVALTSTGTNDAATIDTVSTNVTGAITEDAQGHGIGNETATGTIAFKDADLNDTHTVNAGDPSFVWKSGETIHTLSPSQVAELASRPLQPIRKDLVIRFRRQRLAREA